MSLPIVQMIGTAGDARREVWPSMQFGEFQFVEMQGGDSKYVELGVQAVSWSGNDIWMVGSRSVMSFSIMANKTNGGSLIVETSFNGVLFADYHVFKIVGDFTHTGCTGFDLPGWAVRFKVVSSEEDQTFRGSIMVRGF